MPYILSFGFKSQFFCLFWALQLDNAQSSISQVMFPLPQKKTKKVLF